MSIEKASNIAELVPTNPTLTDPVHNGADHFWLIKNVLKAQFPGKKGDGFASPINANEDELNFVKGVRKSIQDQIDDLVAGASDSAFAKGTTIVFAQPIAPTGWEQVVGDVDNRMMRVVATNGGGMGGKDDPTTCNILPSHTHTFTTGAGGAHTHNVSVQNSAANHNHSVSISAASIDHTHSFSTGATDTNHTHQFSTNGSGDHQHPGVIRTDEAQGWNLQGHTSGANHWIGYGNCDPGGNHAHSGGTGWMDQNQSHSHSGNTNGMSGGASHTHPGQCTASDANHNHQASADQSQPHTHSGATDKTGQDGGWLPRYADVIFARKSK